MITSWYEHCRPQDIPPRWMWPFPDEVSKWFKQVDEDRKNGIERSSIEDEVDDNEHVRQVMESWGIT